jgi:hypothetical protein
MKIMEYCEYSLCTIKPLTYNLNLRQGDRILGKNSPKFWGKVATTVAKAKSGKTSTSNHF